MSRTVRWTFSGPRINKRQRIAEGIGNNDRTLIRREIQMMRFLPVGIRESSDVTGLITLTLASNEFRTNNGVSSDANAELESATKAQKKKRNRDERKEPAKRPLMNEIVALIPTEARLSLESPNRANVFPAHPSPGFKDLG